MPEFFTLFLLVSLAVGLHFLLVFGGPGAVFMAASTQIFSGAGKPAFMNKLSEQAGRLGAWLLLYLGLALAGMALGVSPERAAIWTRDPSLKIFLAAVPVAAILLGLAYRLLRRPLKNTRGAHTFLGVPAALSALALLLTAAMVRPYLTLLPHMASEYPTLAGLLDTQLKSPETWGYFAQFALLSLGAGGAFTLIYLLIRRNRDDYGRDYYAYGAKFASKWSFGFVLASIAPWAFTACKLVPMIQAMEGKALCFGLMGAYTAFVLIAAVIYAAVGRSATPMRHKPAMILGTICLWLALASFAMLMNEAYGVFQHIGLVKVCIFRIP